MVQTQPPSKKHKKAEKLEDLVANLNLPSAESLEALLKHRTTPDPLHALSRERIICGNNPTVSSQLSTIPRGKLT